MLQLPLSCAALLVGEGTCRVRVRGLATGEIGVGKLMTTAAIGALLLGGVAEGAALAFRFPTSGGFEEFRRRIPAG